MMYLGNRKQLHRVFEILFGMLSIELDTYKCQVKIVINVNLLTLFFLLKPSPAVIPKFTASLVWAFASGSELGCTDQMKNTLSF